MGYIWSEEAIKTLRTMAANGRTSYEISSAVGCCRNSVCSKAHRLGIKLKGKPFGPINCAKLMPRGRK